MKTKTNIIYLAFAMFAFACLALAPQARAVCQDACLPNHNTVQGDDALFSLTTGIGDTAIGTGRAQQQHNRSCQQCDWFQALIATQLESITRPSVFLR